MLKTKIQATRLNEKQLRYLENYATTHNFENISQAVRAIINESMTNKPIEVRNGGKIEFKQA